jgi:hypothetical protein
MSKLSLSTSDYPPPASLASMSRRVYPLNLKSNPSISSTSKKPEKVKIPEFAKEFIKDSNRSQSNKKIKRRSIHQRSVSYNFHHQIKQEPVPKEEPKVEIPVLSYKQFKGEHCRNNSGNRYFKPQSIQLNQRAKIVLYSAKPIVIDPSLYSIRKSSVKPGSSRQEGSVDASYGIPPGLTYGEKILKLKSLVESTVM